MVISYKCPGCGDDMAFDAESGTLACRSCGRQDKIENISEELKTARFTEDDVDRNEYQVDIGKIKIKEKL
ncbi:TFIIB-type zinc ribbon-containing protein, partial [Bacillus inaquosorum]|uniref:TFIIB-type zinc ribbon-containing protein n=1 Tax=Bacillus inaquosorum TaxID=483913 RepID=UPI002299ED6B|nr:TFIIB-type zinc ribbon-containing protein [Bacillus inaquosorum]